MIRPFTLICFLLAVGSGAYVYITKYDSLLLDRRIEKTLKETEHLREQTRNLHAEWTLLNDPERLRTYADQYLALKPVAPTQFTSLSELNSRLPAVRAPEPEAPALPGQEQRGALLAQAAGPQALSLEPEEDLPVPPIPVPPRVQQAMASPVSNTITASPAVVGQGASAAVPERKPLAARPPLQAMEAPAPRPVAEARPPIQRQMDPRPAAAPSTVVHAAPPLQQRAPVVAPVTQAMATAYNGSLLGMAQSGPSPAPLPRPLPFNNVSFVGGN